LLSGGYQRRNAGAVVDEIEYWVRRHGVKNVAFYDDALFVDKEQHIHKILGEVLKRGLAVAFHTPNGVFPKEIDESLASLMYESGFRTIRLSYETSNRDRQREMASKVSDDDLATAVEALVGAGYTRDQLGVYVLNRQYRLRPESRSESSNGVIFADSRDEGMAARGGRIWVGQEDRPAVDQ
jgi:hypothetical protein